MVTRSQSGIVKPIDRLSFHTTSISLLPKSPFLDLQNPHWNNAMHDEYNALVKNASSIYLLQQVITSLHNEFDMTDIGALNYFLGISTTRHSAGLFLSQKQYPIELLARAHMTNCYPSRTLVDTDSKLDPKGVPVQDPTLYRSLAGGLQYLIFTRPDISYAVQQICLYMHDPHADWIGCPSTRRSASAETAWLRNLLRELHSLLSVATLVYCDNVSATYLSANPV
nr:hypothetical protein [Tanacetum cinerariifolium]